MSGKANMKQAVRDALAGGTMTYAELKAKTGLADKSLGKAISNLISGGEAFRLGRGEQAQIVPKKKRGAAAGAKPSRKSRTGRKAAKRAKARAAARTAGKKRQRYGDVLGNLLERATDDRRRRHAHVATTLAALEAVIDLQAWPYAPVFRAHKEAVEILTL